MIDHLTLSVSDLAATKQFLTTVLAPLGYRPMMEFQEFVGFGNKKPELWVKQAAVPTTPQHLAFIAPDRKAVDAFFKAAIAAGAKDDGKPGIREMYHPNYYGAFIIDPINGHPFEAVCHLPVETKKAAAKVSAKKAPAKAKKVVKVAAKGKKRSKR